EKNTEGMLKEDAYIEATEDIKASNSSEDRDAHSQEEQTFSENPEELKDENRESETFPKDEVPKEIEIIDFEARNIEFAQVRGLAKIL
ncbi:hypothetical protein ACUU9X_28590, partial [Bacillus cereus]|uniref:hypothetical protein n=1 Tax=Bacillus cereus TaxID=1396 RepID=UPI004054B3B3